MIDNAAQQPNSFIFTNYFIGTRMAG